MPLRKTMLAVCSTLLILVAADGVFAQDKQLEEVNVLAAVKALRAKCAAYSYEVVDTSVEAAVLNQLRKDESKPPKAMPTAQQLQNNLVGDFDLQWKKLITEVTHSLDQDGKKKLAERLNEFVTKSPRIREETEAKYRSFLTKELPQVLERVEKQLVDEQSEQLLAALKEVVATGEPSELRVYEAADGEAAKIEAALVAAVEQRMPAELQPVLLNTAFDALKGQVNGTVKDAVAQLDEQRGVFAKSDAVSKAGLKQDFEERLSDLAQSQNSLRAGRPLLRSFDVFSRIENEIEAEAGKWFDGRVEEVSKQVLQDVMSGKSLPGAPEDERALRQIITGDRQGHHAREESLKELAPKIQEMVVKKQGLIADRLFSRLAQSTQQADKVVSKQQFRGDVQSVLDDAKSNGYKVWGEIAGILNRGYTKVVVPKIRDEIASAQTLEYAPNLTRGQWWPSEVEVTGFAKSLTEAELVRSYPWSKAPPQPKEVVLEETWELWLKNANKAIAVFGDAQDTQSAIVNALKEAMLQQIKKDLQRGQAYWRDEYVKQAGAEWQTRGGEVATHYPDLFQVTREQIDGIIAQLMPEAKKIVDLEMTEKKDDPPPVEPAEIMPDQQEAVPEPPSNEADNGTGGGGAAGNDQQGGGAAGGGPAKKGTVEEADGYALEEGEKIFDLDPSDEGGKGAGGENEKGVNGGQAPEVARGVPGEPVESSGGRPMVLPIEDESTSDMFYRIGFWVLLLLVFIIAGCWYWNVRALKRQIAVLQRRELF